MLGKTSEQWERIEAALNAAFEAGAPEGITYCREAGCTHTGYYLLARDDARGLCPDHAGRKRS